MEPFKYVDSVTGAGKTRGAAEFAATQDTNFCFVMKSCELIDRTIADLMEDWPQEAASRIKYFHTGHGEWGVTKQIIEFLKTKPTNAILFITHSAWQMLQYFHRSDLWHLYVDEAIAVAYNETFWLHDHKDELNSLLRLTPENAGPYLRIEAADLPEMRRIAANKHKDQKTAIMGALANKLCNDHWSIVVDAEQWKTFMAGDSDFIEFHGQFHPAAFEGYASVTIMAANFTDTFTYNVFKNMGVNFEPNHKVKLRYTEHTNSKRLKVKIFTDRPWSKTLHKIKITIDGRENTVFQHYVHAIRNEFKGKPHLWLANKGAMYERVLDGERLPNVPQGLNQFQGYHCCAILCALNPTPAHGVYLQNVAKLTDRQIRRALLSEVAYQALGRGSLRDPDADEDFVLIVPDRMTADDILKHYPEAEVSFLLGYDPVPPQKKSGRPGYPSEEEREAARLESYKTYRTKRKTLSISSFCGTTPEEGKMSISPLIGEWHDLAGDKADIGGMAYSKWASLNDCVGLDHTTFSPTEDFLAELRRCFAITHENKDNNRLISPVIFAHATLPDNMIAAGIELRGKQRGKDNATGCRGLMFDIEHGDMQPEDFAAIFPDLEFITYSSWKHTPSAPRYRIAIPSTQPLPASIHTLFLHTIMYHIEAAGWGGPEADKRHGIDTGKLQEAAMFYLPCQRPDGFLIHYNDGRKPFDPQSWVAKIPDEFLVQPETPPESPKMPSEPPTMPPTAYTGGDAIQRATEYWRQKGIFKGAGRGQFWFLAKRLRAAGCDDTTMKQILLAESVWAHNAPERKSEIDQLAKDV